MVTWTWSQFKRRSFRWMPSFFIRRLKSQTFFHTSSVCERKKCQHISVAIECQRHQKMNCFDFFRLLWTLFELHHSSWRRMRFNSHRDRSYIDCMNYSFFFHLKTCFFLLVVWTIFSCCVVPNESVVHMRKVAIDLLYDCMRL